MGSIYGSVYPIDKIILEGGSRYRNVSGSSAEVQVWKTVMDKFNIDTTKELSAMRAGELNLRKKRLKDAIKIASSDLDKRWLNWELDNTNTRLREISSGTWGDIWGTLVNLSGVKPNEDGTTPTETGKETTPTGTTGTPTEKPKSNKALYIGLGIGAVALIVVAVVVIKKRNEKK
jgi:hypothetical protein